MKKRIVQIEELKQELKDKRQARHGIHDVAKTAIKAAAARIEELEQSVAVGMHVEGLYIEELCRQRKEADEAMRRIRQAAKELIDKLARFNLLCPETLALKAALAYGPETTALINELKRQEAAQVQSETIQHDWLSPAEAEGLRRELQEAKADLATMDADRQDDRLSNPHFGTSPRYVVEVQRDRLKDECEQLRQYIEELENSLAYCNIDCET